MQLSPGIFVILIKIDIELCSAGIQSDESDPCEETLLDRDLGSEPRLQALD